MELNDMPTEVSIERIKIGKSKGSKKGKKGSKKNKGGSKKKNNKAPHRKLKRETPDIDDDSDEDYDEEDSIEDIERDSEEVTEKKPVKKQEKHEKKEVSLDDMSSEVSVDEEPKMERMKKGKKGHKVHRMSESEKVDHSTSLKEPKYMSENFGKMRMSEQRTEQRSERSDMGSVNKMKSFLGTDSAMNMKQGPKTNKLF